MRLNTIKPAAGAKKAHLRVGRGASGAEYRSDARSYPLLDFVGVGRGGVPDHHVERLMFRAAPIIGRRGYEIPRRDANLGDGFGTRRACKRYENKHERPKSHR